MASIKKLAGQTIWYGFSNILARLLNVLLTPLYTYILHTPRGQADFGDFTLIYSGISFANIVYTYGMETAFFRFSSNKEVDKKILYETSLSSLIISTIFFSLLIFTFSSQLAAFAGFPDHVEFIRLSTLIIAVDTLAALPFARLRQDGRPRKYAVVRVVGIIVSIVLNVWFIAFSPAWVSAHPHNVYSDWFRTCSNPELIMIANLAGSLTTLLMLFEEWSGFRFRFDAELWKKIISYSAPFIIIGLGGMINETVDRIMLRRLLPVDDQSAKIAVGIYSANYRISIFITLFIQAFRMSAEPFFFAQSSDKQAPATYARVMKWFVITLCFAFLFSALFLDVWQYFIGDSYRSGIGVVPILLYANIALGIYYNLSVWYKITAQLKWGVIITLIGAALTLVLNYVFIPEYGMWACAWATFTAYVTMMVLSYVIGQRHLRVPYELGKLLGYIGIITAFFMLQRIVVHFTEGAGYAFPVRLLTGAILMLCFMAVLGKTERKELQSLPLIGRFFCKVDDCDKFLSRK